MEISYVYDYVKNYALNNYNILRQKIDEFYQEGRRPIEIYNIISQFLCLNEYCSYLDIANSDYFEFCKCIRKALFLKSKFSNENDIKIMNKTMIYTDNEICIFKPTNFKESSIIGEPICCFAHNQNRWDEHYEFNNEAIYYVYDVMRNESSDDFVAITVHPQGRALVLDKNHNWWSKESSINFIKGLGIGATYITTKEGKSIKTENKHYNNFNWTIRKQSITLTESQIRSVIKKTIREVLNNR